MVYASAARDMAESTTRFDFQRPRNTSGRPNRYTYQAPAEGDVPPAGVIAHAEGVDHRIAGRDAQREGGEAHHARPDNVARALEQAARGHIECEEDDAQAHKALILHGLGEGLALEREEPGEIRGQQVERRRNQHAHAAAHGRPRAEAAADAAVFLRADVLAGEAGLGVVHAEYRYERVALHAVAGVEGAHRHLAEVVHEALDGRRCPARRRPAG